MRQLRPFLDLTLPLIGGFILLDSFIVTPYPYQQMALAGLGFVVIFIGVWRLYDPLLPNKRHYRVLRREVDNFLHLVRQLNRERVNQDHTPSQEQLELINRLQVEMHKAVDRMNECAGVTTDSDSPRLAPTAPPSQPVETQEEPVAERVG